ncbi:MAG: hypothetical protein ACE1ZP_01000 [Myxococcota bacterium]
MSPEGQESLAERGDYGRAEHRFEWRQIIDRVTGLVLADGVQEPPKIIQAYVNTLV